ncbi:MAG: hypothetical protein MUF57_06685 [Gammaproteobacteria bacterium]|nr:hypothetical protein [Gammaproteobacteria bacterium]
MSAMPIIRTAIPKRRYRVGDYSVTVLGEIDSGDGVAYRYIMAFVPDGQPKPTFYVCAEKNRPGGDAAYRLRVVSSAMSEVVDQDDRWGDLDAFAEEALRIGRGALGLAQEQAVRLT